jgi:5,6-dimethylbenzimidazole synthase
LVGQLAVPDKADFSSLKRIAQLAKLPMRSLAPVLIQGAKRNGHDIPFAHSATRALCQTSRERAFGDKGAAMAELADALREAPQFDALFRATFADLLAWRRDVRQFRPDKAPDETTLAELFDLAALAPSVGNCQPTRFVRVDEEARRNSIRANFEAANRDALSAYSGEKAALYARLKLAGLNDAPIHVAVFCDETTEQGQGLGARTMAETRRYSAVCALHTFWLAARTRGLGVGWVSILNPETVAEALEVPRAWTFIAYLCVGFPREEHLIPELERVGWQRREPHPVLRR